MMNDLNAIASQFDFPAPVKEVNPHGTGIINDTYIVTFADPPGSKNYRLGQRAILQRISSAVFPEPALIMENLEKVLGYAGQKAITTVADFLLPPIYRTKQGQISYQDSENQHWRAIGFIEQTMTSDQLQSGSQAQQAGVALAKFHQLLSDVDTSQLHDTLPGFHDTPGYLSNFEKLKTQRKSTAGEIHIEMEQASHFKNPNALMECEDHCFEVIENRKSLATVLRDAEPAIKIRVTHGDPKLNNILFDSKTGKAVSIIDLDTVKPGLIHYDIGDCIRSCCNSAGEMPEQVSQVQFDVKTCEAILSGYLPEAGTLLTPQDFDLLYDVIRLLPYELGLRFFSDYLAGNQYFKVSSVDDNLYRARVQFQLLESIEQKEADLRQLIAGLR